MSNDVLVLVFSIKTFEIKTKGNDMMAKTTTRLKLSSKLSKKNCGGSTPYNVGPCFENIL